MRHINEIIIHCSDTRPDQDITAADINSWHKHQGYDCIGYHFFIRLDGTIEKGRPISREGAHCYGHNKYSIGICYAGGMVKMANNDKYYKDTRTEAQKRALWYLITTLLICFPTITKIVGHHEYNHNKACPCFNVHDDYDMLLKHIQSTNLLE